MVEFKSTPDENDITVTVFEAFEDGRLLGKCLLKCDNNVAEIFALSYIEERTYICEGLIKSAFNFAVFKGAYMGKCSIRGYNKILERLGFEYVNGVYMNDIPTILMGNCCTN